MTIKSKVRSGKYKGVAVFPHLSRDGCYVVSKTKMAIDQVRVRTEADIIGYIGKGYGLRMSNLLLGVKDARLLMPSSIEF